MSQTSPPPCPVEHYLSLARRLLAMGEEDPGQESLLVEMDRAWLALNGEQIEQVEGSVAQLVRGFISA